VNQDVGRVFREQPLNGIHAREIEIGVTGNEGIAAAPLFQLLEQVGS
jgi:hypothetical protein